MILLSCQQRKEVLSLKPHGEIQKGNVAALNLYSQFPDEYDLEIPLTLFDESDSVVFKNYKIYYDRDHLVKVILKDGNLVCVQTDILKTKMLKDTKYISVFLVLLILTLIFTRGRRG